MTGTSETRPSLGSGRCGAASGDGTLPVRIGRYEVQAELGRGMMGVVYAAFDPALGRDIAIKTVRFAFALSPADREAFEQRFFAEARIAAHLSHPGIVVVHDTGRDPESGMLYIALERLQGRTLAEILKEKQRLEWREAFGIVAAVASALHHAHGHGVIHRDVKPANVMVLPSGQPKIMDFGIAHLETAHVRLTAPGEFLGTPLYMSPEQTLGGPLDPRADIFSLGAIAYGMVTGRLAFGPGTLTRIIDRVVHEDPPLPSEVAPDLPPDVDYVVARALAKSPADRYHDARSMAEDAEDVLGGRPPRHRSAWRGPVRRHRPNGPARDDEPILDLAFQEPTRTLFSVDLEAQLAGLVAGVATAAPQARPVPAVRARWAAALALALLAAGDPESRGGSTLLVTEHRKQTPPAPEVRPAAGAAAMDAALAAATGPDAPSRAVAEPPAAAAHRRAIRPGRLDVDFRHPLKTGTLRLWVDGSLVLEEEVTGQARSLLGVRLYRGSLEERLEVSPKVHDIRVQVSWDDQKKDADLRARFAPGSSRRLEIRLRRVPRDLSLQLS